MLIMSVKALHPVDNFLDALCVPGACHLAQGGQVGDGSANNVVHDRAHLNDQRSTQILYDLTLKPQFFNFK
jgi:hypothetical protein